MKFSIRLLYLYLFSFIGLLIIVIGTINLVDLGLRQFVFTQSDYVYVEPINKEVEGVISEESRKQQMQADRTAQKQRQLSNAIAMIIVGAPLYAYHWKIIKKEGK